MKEKWSLRMAVLLFMLASLLLTAAAPAPAQFASAENLDLVKLTIKNKNSSPITIKLQGPGFYYFSVKAESTAVFTVERGVYTATIYACGASTTGNDIDLSRQKVLVMPVCGGNAGPVAKKADKVDLSDFVKVVPVTIENDSNGYMLVIMTGPATYVFTFKKDESKDLTLVRGDYTVKYYACSSSTSKDFYANKNSTLKLGCPK